MAKEHNKKRNVGLIYELLLRQTASYLLEGKEDNAKKMVEIIRHFFREGTELHKEYRLFTAFIKTNASSERVADTILSEAKIESTRVNHKKLDKEKTRLIHVINKTVNDDNFYRQRIPEYKLYATTQCLLNHWRGTDRLELAKTALYENVMREHLLTHKQVDDKVLDESNFQRDPLVERLMMNKVNEQLSTTLEPEQASIVKYYIMPELLENCTLKEYFESIKRDTLAHLDEYLSVEKNQIIHEKASSVKKQIAEMSFDDINDTLVERVMQLSQLKHELCKGESL